MNICPYTHILSVDFALHQENFPSQVMNTNIENFITNQNTEIWSQVPVDTVIKYSYIKG